jgi:hypothetical protein
MVSLSGASQDGGPRFPTLQLVGHADQSAVFSPEEAYCVGSGRSRKITTRR